MSSCWLGNSAHLVQHADVTHFKHPNLHMHTTLLRRYPSTLGASAYPTPQFCYSPKPKHYKVLCYIAMQSTDDILWSEPFRVTRKHGGLANVVKSQIKHNNALHANTSSAMGWCPEFECIYVRANGLWRDGMHLCALFEQLREVYSLRTRYNLLHNQLSARVSWK